MFVVVVGHEGDPLDGWWGCEELSGSEIGDKEEVPLQLEAMLAINDALIS